MTQSVRARKEAARRLPVMHQPQQRDPNSRRLARRALIAAVTCSIAVGIVWAWSRQGAAPVYTAKVVQSFPHDPQAYTQGLVFFDGHLFEGTGKYGQSSLRKVELQSGRTVQSHRLDRRYFGEGITIWQDRILQLTWKSHVGFIYDRDTFNELGRFRVTGEGWGLTHDGKQLIISDGSSTLRFVDPGTFRVEQQLLVHSQNRRVDHLNELEYVEGEIWANIWYKDYIARISPQTGEVIGWIDLGQLLPGRRDREAVLNGIAYDGKTKRIFVTGKNWPRIFEIQLVTQ